MTDLVFKRWAWEEGDFDRWLCFQFDSWAIDSWKLTIVANPNLAEALIAEREGHHYIKPGEWEGLDRRDPLNWKPRWRRGYHRTF